MDELPNKLSALLRLAVQDAQKCEADQRYELSMGQWHSGKDEKGPCKVCLAGAVLAQTCGYDIRQPLPTPDDSMGFMRTINMMRSGEFIAAFYDVADRQGVFDRVPTEAQREAFRRAKAMVRDAYIPDPCELEDSEDDDSTDEVTDYFGRADWSTYLECADILEGVGL